MKITDLYLLQFHEVQENNKWWGENYMEWMNINTAQSSYKGHNMPKILLSRNCCNLTDVKILKWQAQTTKQHYQYWFEHNLLLERLTEIMFKNKTVNKPFCFSCANYTWTRCWAYKEDEVLWEQKYVDKDDWTNHFNYLLSFFKDERDIKIDGKPLMILYNPINVKKFEPMMKYWQAPIKENGLNVICFMNQENRYNFKIEKDGKRFTCEIEFQMNRTIDEYISKSITLAIKRVLKRVADKILMIRCKATTMHYSYDRIWKIVLKQMFKDNNWYTETFADWNNTPKRKNRGQVCIGKTLEKFEYHLTKQIKRVREIYKKDYLFMSAWNEWGEFAYYEPDKKYQYTMLEAVKKILVSANEWDNLYD